MSHIAGADVSYVPTGSACRKLNCRKEALYRWGKTGAIGFFRTPGGDYRWAVDEFIARQRAPQSAADQPQVGA